PPPREWQLLGRLAKGTIGRREVDCVSVRQVEPANCLLYGGRPDLHLPSGRYRLSFRCRAGSPRIGPQPVLGVEVVARNRSPGARDGGWRSLFKPRSAVQARRDFTAEALQTEFGMLDFDVPVELSDEGGNDIRFEFNFLHLGNADLAISAVS